MAFKDRVDAGQRLARELQPLSAENPVVIALLRGGVPVAAEIARALSAPLDVLSVRKIGAPDNPEYGIGAVSEGGSYLLSPRALSALGLTEPDLLAPLRSETREAERRVNRFRDGRPMIPIRGRTVLLVDDGLATGITAQVAARRLRELGAGRVRFVCPVCSKEGAKLLASEVDEVICLEKPADFFAVGNWYEDFQQLSDDEVLETLSEFRSGTVGGVSQEVEITRGSVRLQGHLDLPAPLSKCKGIVLFAHGSGSSRRSPRNLMVARRLHEAGVGTVLFDLLMPTEAVNRRNVFDIPLLARRLLLASEWTQSWLRTHRTDLPGLPHDLPLGFFGASTGAGAALWAASDLGEQVAAVVSRGGRPDLAIPRLAEVRAPTLLLVGGLDEEVIRLNEEALRHLPEGELEVIPGATHLFEEPGTLEQVSDVAATWFSKRFDQARRRKVKHEAA